MRKFCRCAAYLAIIGCLSNIVGVLLPRCWFSTDRWPYREREWERGGKAYRAVGIQHWKDKLPDMSRVLPWMKKKAIDHKRDFVQLVELIEETCVAEFIHLLLILMGLPCMKMWHGIGGIIVFFLWAAGNLPFIMIQRYNRLRLTRTVRHMRGEIEEQMLTTGVNYHENSDFDLQYRSRT